MQSGAGDQKSGGSQQPYLEEPQATVVGVASRQTGRAAATTARHAQMNAIGLDGRLEGDAGLLES